MAKQKNQVVEWKFYINTLEVNEPIGWDGFRMQLIRSINSIGLENIRAEGDLSFDGVAARMISNEFALNGYDGTLDFVIKTFCNGVLVDSISWALFLITYKRVNNIVTIFSYDTSFAQKFRAKIDTKVALDDLKSVGGTTLFPAPYKTISLHSKAIVFKDILKLSPIIKDQKTEKINIPEDRNAFVYFPFESERNESGGFDNATALSEVDFAFVDINSLPYTARPLFTAQFDSLFKFEYKFKGNITLHSYNGQFSFAWNIVHDKGDLVSPFDPLYTSATHKSGTSIPLSINYDKAGTIEIFLKKGEKFTMYQRIFNTTNNFDYSCVLESHVIEASFKVTTESLFPASDCRVMLIHDVFARVCELISDEKLSFRSDFFGLTNQYPFYEENGCGAFTTVTNGKSIRNMLQKDGTPYPVSMTFLELFKACDAVWNLGWRIEYDNFGKGIIRVEPKAYFFQNSADPLIYSHVSDVEYSVATDFTFNGIKIGYSKWNLSQGSVNGIDEFNTKHEYSLPNKTEVKKIDAVSTFIASGYVLELTRRQQHKDTPTSDFETDDENFFICVNPEPIESSKHSKDEKLIKYLPGTASERNEFFPEVENLISPDTAYNLRISPKRNLMRWWSWLSPSLYYMLKQNAFTAIKFQSGEGNVLMKSRQIGNCKESLFLIGENQNLTKMDLDNSNGLFIPVKIKFTCPAKINEFIKARKEGNKNVLFSCNENYISTHIMSFSFEPAGPGNGVGEFILLIAGDSGAAFDDGFSTGFDI